MWGGEGGEQEGMAEIGNDGGKLRNTMKDAGNQQFEHLSGIKRDI